MYIISCTWFATIALPGAMTNPRNEGLFNVQTKQKENMKRILVLLAIALCISVGAALQAHAQTQLGFGIAYGSDYKVIGIEGRAVVPIAAGGDLRFAPNVTYFLVENGTFYTFDANLQYVFAPFSSTGNGGGYALAGLDIARDASNTELGLNLGAGIQATVGFFDLFGEVKFVLGKADQVVLTGGLLFGI